MPDVITPAELLWRADMPDVVIAAHDRPRTLSPQIIHAPPGTLYGGRGMLARDGALIHPPGFQPAYIAAMIAQMGLDLPTVREWTAGFPGGDMTIRPVAGPALAPVHPHWHYGHFLLESLPRLLFLDRTCDPACPVMLALGGPDFVAGIVAAALGGRRQIITFDPATEALAPDAIVGAGDLLTTDGAAPDARALFDDLATRLSSGATGHGDRLFLSRRGVAKSGHRIRNMDGVERLMADLGFTILQPESLPFADQIAAMRGARIVVGEYGSAMHNAIFCRPGTTVVCLNWINGYQSQIAALMGLRQGFILPADGMPHDTARLWAGNRQMRFLVADLRARLRPLL